MVRSGGLRMEVSSGGFEFGSGLSDGAWHMVAFVMNAGDGIDDVDVYLDGTYTTRSGGGQAINTQATGIPGVSFGADQNGNRPFTGIFDQVQIYDTALDEAALDTLAAVVFYFWNSGAGGGDGSTIYQEANWTTNEDGTGTRIPGIDPGVPITQNGGTIITQFAQSAAITLLDANLRRDGAGPRPGLVRRRFAPAHPHRSRHATRQGLPLFRVPKQRKHPLLD